jgi:hypothetical protein
MGALFPKKNLGFYIERVFQKNYPRVTKQQPLNFSMMVG